LAVTLGLLRLSLPVGRRQAALEVARVVVRFPRPESLLRPALPALSAAYSARFGRTHPA
jgi:hypothetical protein